MHVARQVLFDGELLQVVHARAWPSLQKQSPIECQSTNILVLPLAGVFAMHDGPRRHAIATPNHAVFMAAGKPYRISLPTGTGDECVTLRFSAAALARLAPEAMSGDGFDLSAFESCAPIAPQTLLARSVLWRNLARGETEPLEVEETGVELLTGALRAARKDGRGWKSQRTQPACRLRRIGRVMDAVASHPERKWTLDALAAIAHVSPWHLSHLFREETGATVSRYVLRARLARALDALLDSDAELSAIAHESGFANHSHFTARFRRFFGATPLELRRGFKRAAATQMRKIVTAQAVASH